MHAPSLTLLLAILLGIGALFTGPSIPLIRRRVPPNPWYGLRVRKTLASPVVWYPEHVYSSWLLVGLGVGIMLVAIAAYCIPGMDAGIYTGFVTAFLVVGLVVTSTLSFAYVGNLPDPDSQGPGDSWREQSRREEGAQQDLVQ